MTTNPLHEKLIEEIKRKSEVINDSLWYVNPENVRTAFLQIEQATREECKVTENTSDGYHTFKELYEFRKLYNAVLFNEWARQHKYKVHKSIKHNDDELCFGGGWFVVMAKLPTGQISNHYEMKDWDLFNVPVLDKAEKWDGHTSQDVATRLEVEAITKLTT